jgi:hypothetical protein
MAEAGLKINGKFYAIPQSLRVGETRMIKRITGLNPPEFMKALNELDETQDPDVGAAMVWWVVHREDPSFTIDAIDDLEWDQVGSETGDDAEPVDPKAGGAPSASSPTSADASSSSPDATGETTHANGGDPDLALYGHAT